MEHAQRRNGSRSKAPRRPSPLLSAVVMEQSEVARRLHLTIAQVQVAQENALRKLRCLLEARGVTRETVAAAFNPAARRPADSNEPAEEEDGALRLLRRLFGVGALDDDGEEPD